MNEEIVHKLQSGHVGILPTDTLYGLVGSAMNPKTVERIYALRIRDRGNPLIVLIHDAADVSLFGISLSPLERKIADRYWPGRVSIVLPCPHPEWEYLHRGTATIAFRVPADDSLRRLLADTGPLVAPSANRAGEPPALTIPAAREIFGDTVDFYEDRGRLDSPASTVIQVRDGAITVLRPGKVEVTMESL